MKLRFRWFYLPLGISVGLDAGHVSGPELHALGATAGHGDHLVLLGAADGEVDVPERKSFPIWILKRKRILNSPVCLPAINM
jgi:hypothetical protein